MSLRVGVVGAGEFGRGIALASARNGHEVVLWSRKDRELPDTIRMSADIADLRDCELIFLAVPARPSRSSGRSSPATAAMRSPRPAASIQSPSGNKAWMDSRCGANIDRRLRDSLGF